ncbi:MAG: hypothetical protein MHM6MM_007265 [Cercozoa sp. M6MM]
MAKLSERYELAHPDNPVVFIDISIGGQQCGRVLIELFKHKTPKTAENFRQFCTGEFQEHGRALGYKDTPFHRVIKDFMVQGGDFVSGDGRGCKSIYGDKFDDEDLTTKHDAPGLLSMANSGANSNGCQFFITCAPCPWLDGRHCVFGRVLDGHFVVRRIENVPTDSQTNQPTLSIAISECGEM